MKKPLSLLLAAVLCLSAAACSDNNAPPPGGQIVSGSQDIEFTSSPSSDDQRQPESPPAVDGSQSPADTARPQGEEVRSVWISYLELNGLIGGKSGDEYRAGIAEVLKNCADFGLNTVILQVRPFGDAIYPSDYFPQSYLFTGTEGKVGEAPFDALQIAIEEAHKLSLRIEAWVNPYRVRAKADKELSPDNPANAMLRSGDAVKMGEVITYNPASKAAQQLIVDGVTELVQKYEVDGIHFDDYFYPTTDEAFDAEQYAGYKAGGGSSTLAEWRRENVTTLIDSVYKAIKAKKPSVLFGISPQGNMGNNLDKQYVDIESIIEQKLIDYICPQMYFGFNNSGCPYQSTIEDFNRMAKDSGVSVYVGLATYKFNKPDTWAGDGKNEWLGTTDIIKRQVEAARALSDYGGFVLYRYDSSFNAQAVYPGDATAQKQVKTEMQCLKDILP